MHLRSYLYGVATALAVSGALAFAQGMRPADNTVLATVNGEPLTYGELANRLLQYHGEAALDAMINRAVVRQAAEREKVTVTPQELQARLDEAKRQIGSSVYTQWLEQNGLTEALHRDQLTYTMLQEKLALKARPITDADLERMRVRIIATASEQAAKDLIGRLRMGADFGEVARRYSDHPSKANLGELPPFIRIQMPHTWAQASQLSPGQYTREPQKATSGFLIIKLEERIPASRLRPAERSQLVKILTAYRSDNWLETARKSAQITHPVTVKSLVQGSGGR